MINQFEKIETLNFGPYYKRHTFDFNINSKKNIVNIYGGNGSGKTSLIKLLKLGLYGKLIFSNKNYNTYIKEIFNNKAQKKNETKMEIKLDIHLKIKGKIKHYTIVRKWDFSFDDFEERFAIYQNKEKLSPSKALKIQKYIKLTYPEEYFDFFLFDGNQFDPLIKSNFRNNFEDILKTIFNLDLVQKLLNDIKDIGNIDNKIKMFETMDMMKYQYQKIKEEIQNTQNEEKKKKLKKNKRKLNKKLKKQYKKNKFPILKNNLMTTFKTYHQHQYSKKMKELQKNYDEIVNSLVIQVKKTDMDINNMKIDFFQNDLKYDLEYSFSTAEGQLLYFALLVALLKTSDKSFPIIVDNPFLSMDKGHSEQIKNMLTEFDQQVILLNLEKVKAESINNYHQLSLKQIS